MIFISISTDSIKPNVIFFGASQFGNSLARASRLSSVMAGSNLCYATFAKDLELPHSLVFSVCYRCLIYRSCREPHFSYAMPLKTWIYSSAKDPHVSNAMTRSNLCYAMFAKDLELPHSLIFAVRYRCWIYRSCRKPHLFCAMPLRTWIYMSARVRIYQML